MRRIAFTVLMILSISAMLFAGGSKEAGVVTSTDKDPNTLTVWAWDPNFNIAALKAAEKIYQELLDAGIDVIYDDRKESAGVKFADADLIGVPIRITLGNRSLKEKKVEVKLRSTGETTSYDIENLAEEIKEEIRKERSRIEDNLVDKNLVK